jgi:Haloacid Dehalogenase superfamily, subfamily IB, phosphoserine phosphatase-like
LKYESIIFLDFDGTVTSEETLSGALMRVIPKEQMLKVNSDMRAGRLKLNEVLHMAFDSMPADSIGPMLEYYRSVPLREGFDDFLDLTDRKGIPVVLLSGGLEPFVKEILGDRFDRFLAVHCVGVDTSDGFMKLMPPDEGDGYLMRKDNVMRQYDYDSAIAIGDGITDVAMAMGSDICFARDDLARHLAHEGMRFYMWDDFFDINEYLEQMLEDAETE